MNHNNHENKSIYYGLDSVHQVTVHGVTCVEAGYATANKKSWLGAGGVEFRLNKYTL